MKRFIGILLFLIIPELSFADSYDGVLLKDNLRLKAVQKANTSENQDYIIIESDLSDKLQNKKQKAHKVSETDENLKIEKYKLNNKYYVQYNQTNSDTQLKNKENVQIPQLYNTVKTSDNKKLILNDRVLDIILNKSMQLRPAGIIYSEKQKEISSINPVRNGSVNDNYPGLRGPNQLVIYTPTFGLRTGTNEFGTEAVVENGMVVRLNGADSIIPKNGFVISGHGSAKKWITQNIQVGSKVYIDYTFNTLNVFLTPDSLIFSAKERIKEVNHLVDYYKNSDILYNNKKAEEYLESAKNSVRKAEKKPEKTQNYIADAMNSLDNAIKNALPYKEDELKGIWVRPVEKNQSQIADSVDKLYKSGITDIFLETYFHGKTIYPSEYLQGYGVISQREEFVGFDPLAIWIKEAHKKNMKVHVWFETFYVGNDNPITTPNHILNIYPQWSNKRLMNYMSEVPVSSLSEHNGYFLDPANIEVQTFLLGIINEITEKYKPDGINLDYIRYPQTVEPTYSNYASMNWGYTEYARNEFQSIYGVDPINIQYGTPDWTRWAYYRQSQIDRFLIETKKITKAHNILLTTVIFPDLNKCMATKMQNWKNWSLNNYVDGITPLILTGDKNTAEMLLKNVVQNTSSETKIYPGIFVTFMGGSMDDLLIQIQKTREYKTKGAVLFDFAHLSDKYIDSLNTRVFNKSYSK